MRNKLFSLVFLATTSLVFSSAHAQDRTSLAGHWHSTLGTVKLPGSLLTNRLGDDVDVHTHWTGSLYDSSFYFNPYMEKYRHRGQMKFPFFLTPDKHYVGNITYSKSVFIPKSWKRKKVILVLERPHIETTLQVNGQKVGHEMSLSVPHRYDITNMVKFGAENQLDIDVYNGIENVCVGQDSHSVTDQTQGNWNGIAGDMYLMTMPKKAEIYSSERPLRIRVDADIHTGHVKIAVNELTYQLHIDHPQLWSEFTPKLYTHTVDYHGMQIPVKFGFRQITIQGRRFYLNGNPIWIRGTVENCNFPLTGYPPTDVESWMTIFKKCKEYGLNMMRFHSYCPPEAAFIAADSVGFYLQPEGPSWPNHGVKLRRKMAIDQYLMEETKRIIDEYGNHPSFVMMAAGNEPAGDWVSWCNDWVDSMKVYDNRRVYCGASVGGGWAWDNRSEYHVKGGARGLNWDKKRPQSEDDYYQDILYPRNFKPTTEHPENTEPYVSHEQGQWCVFPDLKERSQYVGVYKAKNFDIFEDLLRDHGMGNMAEKFLHSSGKLQTLAYKYELERNLRTKDYAGFQLLGLNDYSGQGTALVGPLNVFWREKGYVDGKTWRQFCSSVVPLAKFPKFIYTNAETLQVPVELYNASGKAIEHARSTYTIYQGEEIVSQGELSKVKTWPQGKNIELGRINYDLSDVKGPAQLTLKVDIDGHENQWDFWVYPEQVDMKVPKDIHITDTLDAQAEKILAKGGKVLLLAAGKIKYGSDIKQTYLPVFWNTSWFKMRPPHTTGAYIDTKHPLFAYFPSDDWTNLNWWELVNRAQVMNFSELPKDYQSPIQPIDTWHISRKLGMMIEAQIGKGRLLMTTMDLQNDLDHRIVARQMRKAILDYMHGDKFNPSMQLSCDDIRYFYTHQSTTVNMYTHDSPDELKPKIK